MEPQTPYPPSSPPLPSPQPEPPVYPPQPPPEPTVHDPLSVMQPGEQVVCEIKRHPIGIIGMYVGAGFLLLVLAIVVFIVGPSVFSSSSHGQVWAAGLMIFIIAAAISTGFLFIASKVYWGNSWLVTTTRITQVARTSLFDKQTSQLSFANLEDMSADQDGVLAQMFHYGVISAETAAATDKFTFIYCPNPTYYAQKILEAREHFEAARHQSAEAPPAAVPLPPPVN